MCFGSSLLDASSWWSRTASDGIQNSPNLLLEEDEFFIVEDLDLYPLRWVVGEVKDGLQLQEVAEASAEDAMEGWSSAEACTTLAVWADTSDAGGPGNQRSSPWF